MFKFQETMIGDAAVDAGAQKPAAEKIAEIVRAAEATFSRKVLYPPMDAMTVVDSKTGRALEEVWGEFARAHGSEHSPEMQSLEGNPLARGLYVFEPGSSSKRYTVWDNRNGDALTGFTDTPAVAIEAAVRMADWESNIQTPEEAVDAAERSVESLIEHGVSAALGRAKEDAEAHIRNISAAPYMDEDTIAALSRACARYSAIDALASEVGCSPMDGETIKESLEPTTEQLASPAYFNALGNALADMVVETMNPDFEYLDEQMIGLDLNESMSEESRDGVGDLDALEADASNARDGGCGLDDLAKDAITASKAVAHGEGAI